MGNCCQGEELQKKEEIEVIQVIQNKDDDLTQIQQQQEIPVRQSVFIPNYDAMSPKTQAKYQPYQIKKNEGRNQSVYMPNYDFSQNTKRQTMMPNQTPNNLQLQDRNSIMI